MYKSATIITFILILIITAIYIIPEENKAAINTGFPEGDIIRFHVLANSDAPEDQILKEKVRDAILPEMSKLMVGVEDVVEGKKILQNNLQSIKAIATQEIKDNGKAYPVEVVLENHLFPTRKYGDMVLAAGEYEALRVIIGEGKGQNWWCVMFPPLCFVDIKSGLIDEKTKEELQKVLSEDEYQILISESDTTEVPIQLKSKIWEWIKSSKDNLMRFASKF
ncbi:stage II sporulation protein R [Alkaliphilus serpentinus]|uniref:Stage II sporulation protein R n=1 Tax=Alkaliphilus serpentinus TaxID=1482731 RepID=A0A833HQX9_9FIRM|nr:stage II sporulation protein R [Alkaliphilus serpentinus]KAB3532479.1 stage II sporulation protein R [Alkaliphilus serpentinus]